MEQISCRELGKTHYVFFLTGSIMSFFKLLVLFSTLKQLTLKQSCFNAKILKNVWESRKSIKVNICLCQRQNKTKKKTFRNLILLNVLQKFLDWFLVRIVKPLSVKLVLYPLTISGPVHLLLLRDFGVANQWQTWLMQTAGFGNIAAAISGKKVTPHFWSIQPTSLMFSLMLRKDCVTKNKRTFYWYYCGF